MPITALGELDLRLTAPITKATPQPDGSLLVEGIATSEAIDSQGEVVDYGSAKSAFATWRGNIREQHDPAKAVGRGLEVLPDDEARNVYLKAFVSKGAPDTQAKVLDGTLSYFSIGGRAREKKREKTDKGGSVLRIFLERLSEVSLVDSGANPDSAISVVKAEGDALLAVDLDSEEPQQKGDSMTRDDVEKMFGQEIRDARQAIEILDALKAFIISELGESDEPTPEPVAMADPEPPVEKARDWQAEHDEAVSNGAKCSTGKAEELPAEPVVKMDEQPAAPAPAADSETVTKLADLAGTLDTLKADFAALREENASLKAQVEKVGERVVEPGRPVSKEASNALALAQGMTGSSEASVLPVSEAEILDIVQRAHGDSEVIKRDLQFAISRAQTRAALTSGVRR